MQAFLGRGSLALTALLVITSACASAGSRTPVDRASQVGSYTFTERVPDTSPNTIILEGQVRVTADSVEFDMTPGPCMYALPSQQSNTSFIYNCGDVRISIDRDDPTRVNYSLTTRITKKMQVCARRDPRNNACLEFRSETIEEDARRSGRLRLIRN